MTTTDFTLYQMARAFTDATFVTPNYFLIGTTVVSSIGVTDTGLSGEIGTRIAITKSVSGNTSTYSAIRTPADVVDNINGDVVASIGLADTDTAGNLMIGLTIGGLTQTTQFNIEFESDLIFERQ